MKTNTALVLLATAALAALAGCAGTSGGNAGSAGSAGSGYRNGSGVEMFGTIDTSVRRVETK
ncbi:hypothetical protein ACSFA3_16430 [Variovorax sp. RHLX14]|uniref:hypothetical protein n=1 Tax=Variovorax sp. RHLX14 TaxID=1259731 RepID=UPI003F482AE0